MSSLSGYLEKIMNWLSVPDIKVMDIIEILIVAFLLYQIMLWIKNTKAWMLLRGIVALGVFLLIAYFLQMKTILWLARNVASVLAMAAIVIFHPELRRALEKLGERNALFRILPGSSSGSGDGKFSDKVREDIISSCLTMGRSRTGALLVVEKNIRLSEYERTGIPMDALVSSQILLNIFEHNTPLHDGAAIIRGDRIVAATCYLPLSEDKDINKALGTRHRAGLGMSEISDALVIIVSEETGKISVAKDGVLDRNITEEALRDYLREIQNKTEDRSVIRIWKGRNKDEEVADE